MHVDRNRPAESSSSSPSESRRPSDSSRSDSSRPTESANDAVPSDHAGRGVDAKVALGRCSYCGGAYDRQQSNCPPFCSTRCQQLDLRNWLNESYGLPYENESRPEDISELDEMGDDDDRS